jgi:hypothetical protein
VRAIVAIVEVAEVSNVPASGRSFETITATDLQRLTAIAVADLEDRYARFPRWRKLYADRVLATALCQGAALHLIDGTTGVQDFDVWTFYARHPDAPFPPRWRTVHDFGDSKFGQSPDTPEFVGRRIDCWARSVDATTGEEPVAAIRRYLSQRRSPSASFLSQKAVVLLTPTARSGEQIWPVTP